MPVTDEKEMTGSERAKWESMSKEQKQSYGFDGPVQEMNVTQEIRQEAFDNYQTTDDHGMHITGMAKDQNGNVYYKVKNSWNRSKSGGKILRFLFFTADEAESACLRIQMRRRPSNTVPKRLVCRRF